MSNTKNGSDQWKKDDKALRHMVGRRSKENMMFLCYPHVSKENSMAARVRWDNRCVADRASYIICRARCKMKMQGLLFTKLAKSSSSILPSVSGPAGIFTIINVALSWMSQPHSSTPQLGTYDAFQLQPSHPTPTPCSLTAGEGHGTTEQVPECVAGGTRVAPT